MDQQKTEEYEKAKAIIEDDGTSVVLDENHMETVRSILSAVNDLPGVFDRVEAYMMGAGTMKPKVEIEALHNRLY